MPQFAILLPHFSEPALYDDALKCLADQSAKEWTVWYTDPQAAERDGWKGDARLKALPGDTATLASLLNTALQETGADYLLPLPERVTLAPDALAAIAEGFASNPKAAIYYSSYREQHAGGKSEDITLYPHEGCPHERFDFGFIKVYRAAHLREIGGVRTDLKFAAEYDVELRLCDNYELCVIDRILYTVHIPAEPAGAGASQSGQLHSPGKGKLGGFSYVFYPPDLEAEITTVFEEMLKRRGAWIDHPTVEVPYPAEPYPLLATVVIPVLNRSKYIGNAIDRVLEGTFTKFEVVIVDNGSTDGTQDVVNKYAEKDPRVRLVQRSGGSISNALNEGIRAARGKYICQLDSDDEYTPDTLEKMVGHMESHPKCGLAISYYELMDENRGKVEGVDPVTHKGYTRNQILRRDGAGALRVFPKVVLEEMGYYDEEHFGNFGEDYDMVLKVGEKYDVDRVHAVLYRYRRHSDNTDVTRDPLMKIQNKNNARLNALRRRQEINRRLGKASQG